MISTRIRRFGAAILMLFTLGLSGEVLAKQHEKTSHHQLQKTNTHGKKLASSKKEYSRNSVSSSLPDLRKYPSGTPRKKAFLRTVMPYITSQNAAITAERNWLISKQYEKRWSPSERARLKDITQRYKVKWSGNTRHIPWNNLLERVDIIPTSMVATMAAAESGWGTSKLARTNNNLFGMRCAQRHCNSEPGKVKGYLHYGSLKESVNAYAMNLNTHQAYSSFRKSRAQLRRADQEVTATNMIHKLQGYSTKGKSYNNYLFAMYQDNRNLMPSN
ncbi:protein bax [Siccibacter turicensis]|uniref:Mannosyl-glycoprotein endo-beta-N-acetylglucosamidase-like domain-containing protein n=1 Tax=Siccibacter turicensis TaxID=357233 RepID=A0A2P8VI81_9ENTR|nr:protein bax [Siccibacter turicensis]PSN07237.1 hypothetical protein C7G83_13355 [Siccibacter turicensis]